MPYTPQTPSGKEQNQGRSLGDLWRVKQSGGPLELGTGWGPRQEVFTPYRDPTGLGSRPAWLQLYAIVTGSQQPGPPPGAPRYLAPPPAFVQRAAHNLVQAGLPGPPRCQGDSCRISLPGSSCWCPPKGGDPRDKGMPPTFSEGEKGPRSHGCVVENRCAHTLASDSWQPQQHHHQNFPGAESHFREFSLSASVPLPGQDPVYSKQQEIGAPEVHTPASTFSTPWPGQRAQGRCPAPRLPALSIPGSGVLRRGAANLPW